MNDIIKTETLLDGVRMMRCKTNRFKNTSISVRFAVNLEKETLNSFVALCGLLRYTSAQYQENVELEKKLASLYGANFSASSIKKADALILKFNIDVIADKFAIDGEEISTSALSFLLGTIFEPDLDKNGLFKEKNINREKRLMLEAIESDNSDKMVYSAKRFDEIFYQGEGAALSSNGFKEGIEELTAEKITCAWKKLLSSAEVFICIIGENDFSSAAEMFKNRFTSFGRNPEKVVIKKHEHSGSEVKKVDEFQPLSQGKLVLGFSADCEDKYAALLMNAVFGSGVNSKLFKNVREKMSLCYYCSSSFSYLKRTVSVKSGIESSNKEKAILAINEQLEQVKSGNFSDEDLSLAKLMIDEIYASSNDSPSSIDAWYGSFILEEEIYSVEQARSLLGKVDRNRVLAAANCLKLDTVYALLGGDNND